MASTNKTANYGLNQWVKTDPVLMEDFNADNGAIDAALKALADGGLKMKVGSYVGTGKCAYNGSTLSGTPPTLTPGFRPDFVVVCYGGYLGFFFRVSSTGIVVNLNSSSLYNSVIAEWTDTSVRWYHNNSYTDTDGKLSLNYEGNTYSYAVFGQ
ncbi:MAG: hypothetical protein ACI4PC_03640 [Oscillospiraceae bacterium]